MPCFCPVRGYAKPGGGFTASPTQGFKDRPMTVACGRCIGCRMDKSREWATRIAHEASLHDDNCFLTLTYNDENLPEDYSVSIRALQLFMKRLRKLISPRKVRFFACGEYGDHNGRPHYHLILFGFNFEDRFPWRKSASGIVCYRSETLDKLWSIDGVPIGHAEIGTVTKESGGYVARYVIKKVGGALAADHYQRIHAVTGELCWVHPEFMCCSTNPGIGASFIDKYAKDAFPSGFLVHQGQKNPVPRYYKRRVAAGIESHGQHSGVSQAEMDQTRRKQIKVRQTEEFKKNNTAERLATREECLNLKVKQLKRDYEQ